MSETLALGVSCGLCAWYIVVFVAIIIIFTTDRQRIAYEANGQTLTGGHDSSYLTQIKQDWSARTWTDLTVTTENTCPPSHPDDFFFEVWRGTLAWCSLLHYDQTFTRGTFCPRDEHGNAHGYDQFASAPMVQNKINGVRICGARNGPSFDKVQMNLNLQTGGSCPDGYTHCGTNGFVPTPSDTLCLTEQQVQNGDCPIVDFKVLNQNELAPEGYTVQSAGGLTIAFSSQPTALPIQATKLSNSQPCLSPNEQPQIKEAKSQLKYVGELDFYVNGCTTYSKRRSKYYYVDDRFKPTNLKISLYDLQKENAVLNYLEEKPYYTFTVFPGSSVKKPIYYQTFTRPIIPWSLECDLDEQKPSRLQILEKLEDFTGRLGVPQYSSRFMTGLVLGIVFFFVSGPGENLVFKPIQLIVILWVLMDPAIDYHKAYYNIDVGLENLNSMVQFNECFDKYTQIDVQQIMESQTLSNQMVTKTYICLMIMMYGSAAMLVLTLLIVFFFFWCGHFNEKIRLNLREFCTELSESYRIYYL